MLFQASTSLAHHIYLKYHPETPDHQKNVLAIFILNCIFVFTIALACLFIIAHTVQPSYINHFYKASIVLFIVIAIILFVINVIYENLYDIYTVYFLMWHFCTFISFMLTIKFIFHNKGVFETTAKVQYPFEKLLVWLLFFI
jgi:hypothetical protein